MKPTYRAAASAGLLLSACADVGQAATTVQRTVGPYAVSSGFDILFDQPVTSVTDLVEIDDGSVYTGEGATLRISAILTNNDVVQIFSKPGSPPFFNTTVSGFTGNAFTDLATPRDVKGLRFLSVGGANAGTFSFPALTVLTFAVVPEPAAALLMAFGMMFLAIRRRRICA